MHRPFRRRRLAPAALVAVLALAGAASAQVVQLPPNGQVNDDPAVGIDPNQDAGVSDVVGGALDATKPAVPWGTFEQKVGSSQQIFVRVFKNGAWQTQGQSLNIQANQEAEASVDRLRRHRAHRAVDVVVRAQQRHPRRQDADLRQPLQRGRQHLDPRGPGPRAPEPRALAEHPHQPGRREPGAGRRGGQGRRRSRAVGGMAGDRRRRRQEPDLRLARRQAERLRRLHAERQRTASRTSAGSRSVSSASTPRRWTSAPTAIRP